MEPYLARHLSFQAALLKYDAFTVRYLTFYAAVYRFKRLINVNLLITEKDFCVSGYHFDIYLCMYNLS